MLEVGQQHIRHRSGQEEIPHIQGAAASRVQEGGEELLQFKVRRSDSLKSSGCTLLEQPGRDAPSPREEKPK